MSNVFVFPAEPGPQHGDTRFYGEPRLFYLAICNECEMVLPFGDPIDRERWCSGHPHEVRFALDVRPEPTWSPFDEHGKIDDERLKAEGWHHIGAIKEDGLGKK